MMNLIKVSKEVMSFLESSNAVFLVEGKIRAFYVGQVLHTESNKKGLFIRHYM